MNKQTWISHITSLSGLTPPSQGGNAELWRTFLKEHNCKGCVECRKRSKTRKANLRRKEREECLRSLGLVSYRTQSGSIRWE